MLNSSRKQQLICHFSFTTKYKTETEIRSARRGRVQGKRSYFVHKAWLVGWFYVHARVALRSDQVMNELNLNMT